MATPKADLKQFIHILLYGSVIGRTLAVITGLCMGAGFLFAIFSLGFHWDRFLSYAWVLVVLGVLAATSLDFYRKAEEVFETRRRIELAEKKVADHPKEPQAAWELAQVKLESYLNRNLSQVRSVYALTVCVMIVGFALIIGGSVEAFRWPDHFRASVLSSISGIVVSFIGGTFLILHKSIMGQAKDYVTILERINAVGMSMQILNSIDSKSADLKEQTTALIAQQLLSMYSDHVPKVVLKRRISKTVAASD